MLVFGSNYATLTPLVADRYRDMSGVAIGSAQLLWTPSTGKKLVFMGAYLSVSAAVSVLFEDQESGQFLFRTPVLSPNSPFIFDLGMGRALSAPDRSLRVISSAASNITGTLYGVEL